MSDLDWFEVIEDSEQIETAIRIGARVDPQPTINEHATLENLQQTLVGGDDEVKTSALLNLKWDYQIHDAVRNDPTICKILSDLVNSPNFDVQSQAIEVCGMIGVMAGIDAMAIVLDQPDETRKARILSFVSRHDPSMENAKRFCQFVFNGVSYEDDHDARQSLHHFLASQNHEVVEQVFEHMVDYFLRTQREDPKTNNGFRYMIAVEGTRRCDEQSIPWLKQLIGQQRRIIPDGLRTLAFTALVRLGDSAGREFFLTFMKQPEFERNHYGDLDSPSTRDIVIRNIMDALGEAYKATADHEIAALLVDSIDRICDGTGEHRESALYSIADALVSIGGEFAVHAATKLLDQLPPSRRQRIVWKITGNSIQKVFPRTVELGLIDESAYQNALKRLKWEWGDDWSHLDLTALLAASGGIVAFDVESSQLPCPHDQLLAEFVRKSRGVFAAGGISQKWNQRNASDHQADYKLQFVFAEKLFRVQLRNFDDWFDVERLVGSINRALAMAEKQERFVALKSHDQTIQFLFGIPELIQRAGSEFDLEFEDDLNRPMQTGKSFESSVRKALGVE